MSSFSISNMGKKTLIVGENQNDGREHEMRQDANEGYGNMPMRVAVMHAIQKRIEFM